MCALEELASIVVDRVAGGEDWNVDFAGWVVEQNGLKVELAAAGKRLSREEPSIGEENWTDELTARFQLGIAKTDLSRVSDLVRYWRRTISNCAVDALREYRRGAGTRSGSTKIETISTESFEGTFTSSISLRKVETKPAVSEFEIRELEHCVYEQITRNFNQNTQAILVLLFIQNVSQADIARAQGVTASAISQSVARHRELLISLVKKNCLGEVE